MQNRIFLLLTCLVSTISSKAADNSTPPIDEVSNHVIGGVDAAIENYPWMAALVFDHPTDYTRQFCGGTAIDRYWILTAAHCVDEGKDPTDFQFIFNTADLNDSEAAYVAYPSLIVLHPDYIDIFNRENDIALVQLREPLPETIPLVPLADSIDLETPGLSARVTGWGRTTSDPISPEDTDVLKVGEVGLISNEFANLEEYHNGRVSDSMIAAGKLDPYTASFRGDSGGPLLTFNTQNNRWEQIGINSWGAGCSKPENPFSVYTRISNHRDWIDNIVERDFFQWNYDNGNHSDADDDDTYSLLMEYLFDLDTGVNDSPSWLTDREFDTVGTTQVIFTPIIHRSSVPKFEFHYEFSEDLKTWDKLNLDWSSTNTLPGTTPNTTDYLLPTATSEDQPGFFRLRHEKISGTIRGPTPLGVGTTSYGLFNTESPIEGIERFDYILDHLGSNLPIEIQIESDRDDPIRLQLIEVETDRVIYDETRIATEENPHYISVTAGSAVTIAARIESTQTEIEQSFELHTSFFRNVPARASGTRIQNQITSNDSSFRRQNHYSTAQAYQVTEGTTYLIEMESADLDAVFFLRDRLSRVGLEEVDYEIPGVTERHLFIPEETMDLEIIASSWFPDDTGSYELEVRQYTEPSTISPTDDLLGIIETTDETDEQGGTLFYLNRFRLENLSSEEEYEIFVNGRDGFYPQFGILNLTESKTEYFNLARCDQRYFKFQPVEGNDYLLLVVTSERDLGDVFEARLTVVEEAGAKLQNASARASKEEFKAEPTEKEELYSRDSLRNYFGQLR